MLDFSHRIEILFRLQFKKVLHNSTASFCIIDRLISIKIDNFVEVLYMRVAKFEID
jgi:hypothetical protein